MEVVAVDLPTGREEVVDIGLDDTLAHVKQGLGTLFGYAAGDDLDLVVDDKDLTMEDSERMSTCPGLDTGCRVEVRPSVRPYVTMLLKGSAQLRSLPPWVRGNRDCVIAAVSQDSRAFREVPLIWRSDPEVALQAHLVPKGRPYIASGVDDALRGNRRVMQHALQQDATCFKYASDELRNSRGFVRVAMTCTDNFMHLADEFKDDKDIALRMLRTNRDHLKYFSERLRSSKPVVMQAASWRGFSAFAHMGEHLRHDPAVLLALDPKGQDHLSDTVKRNAEMMLIRTRKSPSQLLAASDTLRESQEFVLDAVKNNPTCLVYAGRTMQRDKAVVLGAVRRDGHMLKYAHATLRGDIEVVGAAVQQDPTSFTHATPEARACRDLALEALPRCAENYLLLPEEMQDDAVFARDALAANIRCFALMPDVLRDDKATCLSAVTQDGMLLQYTSARQRSDKDVVVAALSSNPDAFVHATDEARADRDLVLTAGVRVPEIFEYTSDKLRGDADVALAALTTGSKCNYLLVQESLRRDRDFVLQALRVCNVPLCYLTDAQRADKEVVLAAPADLGCTSDALRADPDVVRAAMHAHDSLTLASMSLRSDKGFVLSLLEDNEVTKFAMEDTVSLHDDRDVALCAMRSRSITTPFIYDGTPFAGDREVMMAAVSKHGTLIRFASPSLRHDKDVALAAVASDVRSMRHVVPELRGNKDVVCAAVQRDGRCLRFASAELKDDQSLVCLALERGGVLRHASDRLRNDPDMKQIALCRRRRRARSPASLFSSGSSDSSDVSEDSAGTLDSTVTYDSESDSSDVDRRGQGRLSQRRALRNFSSSSSDSF
eukprot:TRINITY_DN35529_c0_g1_i1.p1 TRINITY_DN35529_c0_g1~~TRINITY_DN35529_c0_g1_i1.p1  ORF type:complete len:848 (+),score=211.69 TRINITY_DN35529_c0_g1_i1:49-2544(+)